jgi:hypothetical protein
MLEELSNFTVHRVSMTLSNTRASVEARHHTVSTVLYYCAAPTSGQASTTRIRGYITGDTTYRTLYIYLKMIRQQSTGVGMTYFDGCSLRLRCGAVQLLAFMADFTIWIPEWEDSLTAIIFVVESSTWDVCCSCLRHLVC